MPTRTNTRAASAARNEILESLQEDHKRVKKAYRAFTRLDMDADPEGGEALVRQVLAELEVHTALEEELLYPAARAAMAVPDLIDEAEVEHESAHALIDQLKGMDAGDEKFAARFTVLCEYVMHHVKEEEGELFPQLQTTRLDWEALAVEMRDRRAELTPADDAADAAEGADAQPAMAGDDSERSSPRRAAGKTTGGPRSRSASREGAEPGQATTSRRT